MHGADQLSAIGRVSARRRRPHEEREPEPEALAVARVGPKRGQHHAVAGGDLAAGGEELAQALLLLGGRSRARPTAVLLHLPQPLQLGGRRARSPRGCRARRGARPA